MNNITESCRTNLDECNPNLHTHAIDTEFQISQILLNLMSKINVSIFWTPTINCDALKRETEQNYLVI